MKHRLTNGGEVWVSAIMLVLLLTLIATTHSYMPNPVHYMLLVLLTVLFGFFAVYLWRETPEDEREGLHALQAGRTSFLTGAGLLTVGIVVQSLQHTLDIWLPVVLGGMVLAKTISVGFSRRRN